MRKPGIVLLMAFALLLSVACTKKENPSVKDAVQQEIVAAGMPGVTVDEDREKGVVTLKGEVNTEEEKNRAADFARRAAGPVVVANEIVVKPAEDQTSDADKALKQQLEGLKEKQRWEGVDVDVKAGAVTLTGEVESRETRTRIENSLANVPGIQQVVNKLEVKGEKGATPATTTTKQ